MWEVVATQVYRQWMAGLPDDVRQAVATSALLIAQFGPQLKRPHADTLKGSKHANMKELQVDR